MKILFAVLALSFLGAFATHSWSGTSEAAPLAGVNAAVSSSVVGGPVAAARRDLANRLSLDMNAIAVVGATERVWVTTCLGLPEEGEGCAATQIEGYRIELWAGDQAYFYRTDTTGSALRIETSTN